LENCFIWHRISIPQVSTISYRYIYSHQFYNIFYCFQVFLVCLLCLQSVGADIGENCTVDVDCNYSNGTCAGLTCGCVTTHYINGTVCTESKYKLWMETVQIVIGDSVWFLNVKGNSRE
jgi:hypothetical protein